MKYTKKSRASESAYISCRERANSFYKTLPQELYPLREKEDGHNNCIWTLISHVYKYTLKLFGSQYISLYSSCLLSINSPICHPILPFVLVEAFIIFFSYEYWKTYGSFFPSLLGG